MIIKPKPLTLTLTPQWWWVFRFHNLGHATCFSSLSRWLDYFLLFGTSVAIHNLSRHCHIITLDIWIFGIRLPITPMKLGDIWTLSPRAGTKRINPAHWARFWTEREPLLWFMHGRCRNEIYKYVKPQLLLYPHCKWPISYSQAINAMIISLQICIFRMGLYLIIDR